MKNTLLFFKWIDTVLLQMKELKIDQSAESSAGQFVLLP